jgi:hypothetical protein
MADHASRERLARLPPDGDFDFEPLDRANLDEAARLAIEVMCHDSPIEAHLQVDPGVARRAARMEHAPLLDQGLSVVAREAASRRLVGFRFARDYATHYGAMGRLVVALCRALDRNHAVARLAPARLRQLAPWILVVDEMHRRWREAALGGRMPGRGAVVLLHGGGVARDAAKRGLLVRMTELTERIAQGRGFRHAVVICTGARSQELLRDRMGYRCRVVVPYEDVLFRGRPVFRGIRNPRTRAPEPCAMLLDRELEGRRG